MDALFSLEQFFCSRGMPVPHFNERIAPLLTLLNVQKGTQLVTPFEKCQHYYFIAQGALRIFSLSRSGEEICRYFAFENMFITALPAFIENREAEEYLEAIEESSLLQIKRNDFYDLVENDPFFAKLYREKLEEGFTNAQRRIYSFQGEDTEEKVLWIMRNRAELLERITGKMLASYLGISPSTLSRLKKRLELI